MNNENRNPFVPEAPTFCTGPEHTELRRPFFDSAGPPNTLDCLGAINRTACFIDMLNHLTLESDSDGALSTRAASGYCWLSETMRDTLIYCTRRLQTLSRARRERDDRKAAYLSALLKGFATLDSVDRDRILNAMAEQLQTTRSNIDMFVDYASEE